MMKWCASIQDGLPLAGFFLAVIGCGGGSGGGGPSETYSVTLSWDAPTVNSDGSPLTDLAGFQIYERTGQGDYRLVAEVATNADYTVGSLPKGTHIFVVTACDFHGNESEFSEEAVVEVPSSGDAAPSGGGSSGLSVR